MEKKENEIGNENKKDKLLSFIGEQLKEGSDKSKIKEKLSAVGWSEDDIDLAYGQALVKIGVPVPSSEESKTSFAKKSSPVEMAINFFSFILLSITASSLGVLFFQVINKFFPDEISVSYYRNQASNEAIHYSISALLIGFPLFWLVLKMWFRAFDKDEGKIEAYLSRFLTYLVLLIASVVVVGDLIFTLFTFLQGELSIRFFLKSLTIFTIAGLVFGFYFLERRKIQYKKPISQKVFRLFGTITASLVAFAIAIGFYAGGSPSTERKRAFDQQRVEDLKSLAECIDVYAQKHQQLPNSLSLDFKKNDQSYCAFKVDPETQTPYEYRIVQPIKPFGNGKKGVYELCANFSLPAEDSQQETIKDYYYDIDKWVVHSAGRDCDENEVFIENKEIYLNNN